ncbi:hypothetical protein EPH_0048710 [Eimeria praecox]|uniref:Uncharacterized protein n=1 Tax=Eimeria praecox TaxID=51316 RepID=U6GEL1_9EIME|nr:hypothetical protein EPH_0048710 [Eimeria praecox]
MFVGLGRFGRRSNGWSVGVGEVACMAVTACSTDGLFSCGTGIREAEHLRGSEETVMRETPSAMGGRPVRQIGGVACIGAVRCGAWSFGGDVVALLGDDKPSGLDFAVRGCAGCASDGRVARDRAGGVREASHVHDVGVVLGGQLGLVSPDGWIVVPVGFDNVLIPLLGADGHMWREATKGCCMQRRSAVRCLDLLERKVVAMVLAVMCILYRCWCRVVGCISFCWQGRQRDKVLIAPEVCHSRAVTLHLRSGACGVACMERAFYSASLFYLPAFGIVEEKRACSAGRKRNKNDMVRLIKDLRYGIVGQRALRRQVKSGCWLALVEVDSRTARQWRSSLGVQEVRHEHSAACMFKALTEAF